MKQSGLTYLLRVRANQADRTGLKAALEQANARLHAEHDAFCGRHPTLHYMCFLLLERSKAASDPVDLVWEINCDGPPGRFIRHFVQAEAELLAGLFRYCEGGPKPDAGPGQVRRFLRGKERGWSCYYIAFPGKSVREIKAEARLQRFVSTYLNDAQHPVSKADPPLGLSRRAQLYLDIKRALAEEPEFAFLRDEPPDPPLSLASVPVGTYLKRAALVLVAVGAAGALADLAVLWKPIAALLAGTLLLSVLAVAYALLLARGLITRESEDPAEAIRWDPHRIEAVTQSEDTLHTEQNHLTHITRLKPGAFRRHTAKAVFWAINLLARIYYRRGNLGGIASIHFARWLVTDDGWVVFMSNYDGSWASYLGEFVDRASEGLSAVWSNTRDFPMSSLLLWDGARDEERFLAFGRNHQERSWVWFTAYPGLSVANIQNNAALRRDLGRVPCSPPGGPMNEDERAFWIPLSETELDTWLRRA